MIDKMWKWSTLLFLILTTLTSLWGAYLIITDYDDSKMMGFSYSVLIMFMMYVKWVELTSK